MNEIEVRREAATQLLNEGVKISINGFFITVECVAKMLVYGMSAAKAMSSVAQSGGVTRSVLYAKIRNCAKAYFKDKSRLVKDFLEHLADSVAREVIKNDWRRSNLGYYVTGNRF